MRKSHELLLKYRFDLRYRFSEVEVCYIDRGSPGDRSCVKGNNIRALDAFYMEIESEIGIKYIPYHRIQEISYAGKIVWER
ncbi:MAG: DUF504 domain-containing protein [Methanoregulaceae archaeon]|jgi:uncharacterized protein (UPF0248 family)